MPRRDWHERRDDILDAIERIHRYTARMDFENFTADTKTLGAVIRNLTVIGEASRHIPADVQESAPQIPWANRRGIRNVVVHEYFGVSLPILWETVQNDLPPLVEPLRTLQGDAPTVG
jgi:uncharacterized protein with HEPN domain